MIPIYVQYRVDGVKRKSKLRSNDDYDIHLTRENERVKIVLCAKRTLTLKHATFRRPCTYRKGDQLFLNGYQSWTETREFELNEKVHDMNLIPHLIKNRYHFKMYGEAWFWNYKRHEPHSFTYAYIRRKNRTELIGSLNDHNAFTIIRYKRREGEVVLFSDVDGKTLKAGETMTLFDFVRFTGDTHEVLRRYFDLFGKCTAPAVRGYTSWYLDYQDISEAKIMKALEGTGPEEFDVFQIDDGYETFVGDWLDVDPDKFPNGIEPVVRAVHEKGLKAGIWLAPFVCEIKSRLYRDHNDWVFSKANEPVYAGCNWSGDVALDIRKREVRDYIRKCLEHYMALGFDFFKLDFLYAAAIVHQGKLEPYADTEDPSWYGLTRAQIMRKAMEWLREVLKDKMILGCGVPLASAFNQVDYCRIGPDVSLEFDDVWFMRAMHRERISTKTTLQNTIYRSAMDGKVFRCDPDVYLLRDDHIGLSPEQRRALVTLNHLCGAVYLTSDHVADYDAQKKEMLGNAQRLVGARITDITKTGDIITVGYQVDGRREAIRYDRLKGVLING